MAENQQLPATYIIELYIATIRDYAQKQGMELTQEQLNASVTQSIYSEFHGNNEKDGIIPQICSLDNTYFLTGYDQFINIINKSGSNFSSVPDKKSLQQIHDYIKEVPELMQVYNTILLYRDYQYLINTVNTMDFNPQSIYRFECHIMQISSGLQKTEVALLKNGVMQLHTSYAKKISQINTLQISSENFEPLPANYLDDYYAQAAYNQLSQDQETGGVNEQQIEIQAQKLKQADLQEMQDNLSSFDKTKFSDFYCKLLYMTGLDTTITYSESDDDIKLDDLKNLVQYVPELAELVDLTDIYLSIHSPQTFNSDLEINNIYNRLKSHCDNKLELPLSLSNLANFEYKLINEIHAYKKDNNLLLRDLCIDVLASSDNPSHIHEIFSMFVPSHIRNSDDSIHFPPAADANNAAQTSCNRILNGNQDLSDLDYYNLYLTLGETYSRSINKTGFRFGRDIEHMRENTNKASHYFEAAYNYAQTYADKQRVAERIYRSAPEHYSRKPCSGEFPQKIFEHHGSGRSNPYGGSSININSNGL